jgi:hypothetical protein
MDALPHDGAMSAFEIAYSPEFLAQDREAANQVLLLGAQRGEAVPLSTEQSRSGHMACRFHLVHTATGEDEDGGSASTLLGYLSDGTYPGKPTDYTLVPIEGRGEF